MYPRVLPSPGEETFFLWGARQTGKSTLLKQRFSGAFWIDLLKSDEYRHYSTHPEYLRSEVFGQGPSPTWVIIDEIQKVPALLEEVHWLMENKGALFGLCGSNARKVRRGHANLLGGRAIRYELFGLVSQELGADFDLDRILNRGYLPGHYMKDRFEEFIASYVADYLKEEIAAEGLVRNLPTFSHFLDAAGLCDGEIINYTNIARDCGLSSKSVKGYFDILEDSLLGRWLPAYRKRPKRRVVASPKFYLADVGVVNFLAKRGTIQRDPTPLAVPLKILSSTSYRPTGPTPGVLWD